MQAGHVIADPVHGVFYATVGDDAPVHASSLVVVAALGEVVSSVFVGAWPWTMALSDLCESAEPELGGAADLVSPDGKTLAFVGFGGNFDAPPRLFVFANPFEGE